MIDRIGDEIVFTNVQQNPDHPKDLGGLPVCPLYRRFNGYNVVDTKAAKDKGIPVCNIPTYGTDAVAQYAFALIWKVMSPCWGA